MLLLRLTIAMGLLASLAYYVYVPIRPDITSQPYKLSAAMSLTTFIASIAKLGELLGIGPLHKNYRSLTDFFLPTPPIEDSVEVKEIELDGVRALLFNPKERDPVASPAIVYIHGGGFVHYNPEFYHLNTMDLAKKLKFVVISIDYRKSPEFPYPIPFEDCVHATSHFLKNAKSFGVNPTRVAIAGDSAGGNLATAVALKLHSEPGLPKLKMQILIYPILQLADFNTPSYNAHKSQSGLTRTAGVFYSIMYLMGEPAMSNIHQLIQECKKNNHVVDKKLTKIKDRYDWTKLLPEDLTKGYKQTAPSEGFPGLSTHFTSAVQDPYLSPLSAASDDQLRTLPPTYLITCEYDILRDDGLMFKARLEQIGARIHHKHYKTIHGIISYKLAGIKEADQVMDDITGYFQRNAVL